MHTGRPISHVLVPASLFFYTVLGFPSSYWSRISPAILQETTPVISRALSFVFAQTRLPLNLEQVGLSGACNPHTISKGC